MWRIGEMSWFLEACFYQSGRNYIFLAIWLESYYKVCSFTSCRKNLCISRSLVTLEQITRRLLFFDFWPYCNEDFSCHRSQAVAQFSESTSAGGFFNSTKCHYRKFVQIKEDALRIGVNLPYIAALEIFPFCGITMYHLGLQDGGWEDM